ncbi:MAG: hypothetical protein CLLPBCKN_002174 [Chroococcidiopsis cubana SAG 39.79]|nr:hypothetical protein [Chroococcidiopsis cubana SAG 39.79]
MRLRKRSHFIPSKKIPNPLQKEGFLFSQSCLPSEEDPQPLQKEGFLFSRSCLPSEEDPPTYQVKKIPNPLFKGAFM